MKTHRALTALVAGLAIYTFTIYALLGGTEEGHPGPWKLTSDGQDTGVIAVAALDPVFNGPLIEWVSRAATEADLGIDNYTAQQKESRDTAWQAAVNLLLSTTSGGTPLPLAGRLVQPDLDIPDAWLGQSAGLAYTLAFLDSAPLNPTPGSLLAGRTIAASGKIEEDSSLYPVAGFPAKYAAAKEAGADILFVPQYTFETARRSGELPPEGSGKPSIIPISTPHEALIFLCITGGQGLACELASQAPTEWIMDAIPQSTE